MTKSLLRETPNNKGPSWSSALTNVTPSSVTCHRYLFFFLLHNLCILFLYWHQRLNVCSGHIRIPPTRTQRTMPYMECWTQLLIIKAENVLKSAARFTEEPQTCWRSEWKWWQTSTDWKLWELDTLLDTCFFPPSFINIIICLLAPSKYVRFNFFMLMTTIILKTELQSAGQCNVK